ncbi:PE-PPE domain-containing protein [Mycobacteroides salmoniphilum]|uniref:PE-PPE domain-containing protein n=1 Tax=Mycobacteroides salmoniphilum TaxID=404941 RepID=UPI0009924217|nr:PE-PPE domain-containing protein [Mycobacteroides salmoniphilum]QCH25696.1 putative PPE family protein PPE42 [Mycobacteroides salmoniphilum]
MAAQYSVLGKSHSLKRSIATAAAVAATCTVLAPVAMESRTIASTLVSYVIGVGGNNDGASANIPAKIGHKFVTGSDIYQPVSYPGAVWPVSGITAPTFKTSVTEGNANLNAAIDQAPAGHVTVVAYSLGAVAANKSYRQLAENDPNADIDFVFLGSANTPNGGIFARFPWLKVPFVDIESDGALEPGPIRSTVINTEYDTYGDFPAYFNPLALANSIAAIQYAHPDKYYDEVDPASLDDPNKVIKTQVGNTTYYLVRAEHLPLLQPLRDLTNPIGASFVLDAIEPTLRLFIDMAYDRETSPGTVTPFSIFTPPKNIVDAFKKLPGAIEEGAENFQNGLPGAAPKQPAPADKPTNPPVPQADPAKATPPAARTPEAPKETVLTLTTSGPTTPPAPAKVTDPTAIAVSATTAATPEIVSSAPALQPETKPEATPDEKPTLTSVKDTAKPKDTTKPTLRLPKLPAARPGTTPKTAKLPSIRDSLKSIPGLGIGKAPSTTGGSTDTNTSTTKATGDTGKTAGSGTGDHANSGDSHSASNAA